jgi:hypothetical protein
LIKSVDIVLKFVYALEFMTLYAIDKIEDALERSKEILFPFDLGTWTKFAIIGIFLGGLGFPSFFNFPGSSGDWDSGTDTYGTSDFESLNSFQPESITGMATAMPEETLVLAVAGGLLSLALIFMYLSSVFEFVMYRSIREKNPRIRKNFADHYIDGFKYMLFQIGLLILTIGVIGGWIGSFFVNPMMGGVLTILAIPIMIALAVFGGIVHDFGLQKMIDRRTGFIQAVKESIREVTDDWGQFGGYLLFRLIVTWAVGIASLMTVLILSLVIGLPFLMAALGAGTISSIVGIVVGAIGALIWIVVMLYVTAPFKVYTYSYFVELYQAFSE